MFYDYLYSRVICKLKIKKITSNLKNTVLQINLDIIL